MIELPRSVKQKLMWALIALGAAVASTLAFLTE